VANDVTHDEKITPWAGVVAAARWLLGAFSLVGGLTWGLFTYHGPTAALDLGVAVVLAAAGLVLLMPHRIRLPRLITAAVMAGFAVAGAAAGLLASKGRDCCMFAHIEDRGWPFTWAQRGAVADDPATAERLARGAHWTVDAVSLAADLLLWAYAGMLLVVIVVLVRRRRP
jgi:hypothetical protein